MFKMPVRKIVARGDMLFLTPSKWECGTQPELFIILVK